MATQEPCSGSGAGSACDDCQLDSILKADQPGRPQQPRLGVGPPPPDSGAVDDVGSLRWGGQVGDNLEGGPVPRILVYPLVGENSVFDGTTVGR